MKKLILTGTALMAFAAAGFAQNNATLNQNGTNQTASQTQSGNLHNSTVTQNQGTSTNFGSFATTSQNGSTNNTATVNQNNGSNSNRGGITQSGGAGNNALIDQSNGSGNNVGAINGSSNQSAVRDGGNGGNWGDIQQTGAGNINTRITQGNAGVGGTVRGNSATITTFGNNNGTDQLTGANAPGDELGSQAPVLQEVSIEQSGNANNNEATILQGSSGNNVSGNVVRVRQIQNSGGMATVDQRSNNNYTNVRQFGGSDAAGDRNVTSVVQRGTGGDNQVEAQAFGNGNTQTIDQIGQNNQVYIRQEPENSAVLANAVNNDNTTTITQTGVSNRAVMDMRSTNSNATINQTGTDNYSRYEIIGDSQSNTGTPGDNNDLTVTQNRTFTAGGSAGHQFNGYVAGDNNTVGVTQTGEGNRIGGTNSDDFGLVIDGDGNNLTLQQTGRDNLSNIRIDDATSSADNNTVSINQNNTVNGQGNTVGSTPFGNATSTSARYGLELQGDFSDVAITQNGQTNSVNMGVNSDAINAGQKNEVDVNQTGSNNRVGTGGSVFGTTTVDNTSARGLYITGNSNKVVINQNGGDEVKATQNGNDELTVNQTGTSASAQSNRVLINQGGTGKQVATITQSSDGNFVYGLASSPTGATPGMASFASQSGAGINTLTVDQSGAGAGPNNAFVGQTGAGNNINITQTKQ